MTTNICNSVYTDPALTYVDLGFATLFPYADRAVQTAFEQMDAITNFEVPFHQWTTTFNAPGDLTAFIRPPKPTFVDITPPDDFVIPNAPSVNVPLVALTTAPSEPANLANPPSFTLTPKPAPVDLTRPAAAPVLTLPVAPAAPVLADPDAPTLVIVALPDVPDVDIVPFSELAPEFVAAPPDETLNFTETAYASALLNRVREQVTAMIDGTYYLPAAVAAAIWDQSVQREDKSSMKLEQEAREMHVSRGFTEPNGVLDARIMEVKYQNRDKRAELNRQVYIRTEEVALENLRFGVQQGLALETTLLQAHLTIEARKFELTVKAKDVAIAVFNARVQQYNASIQAYNARIDAYKAFIDGLRQKVEVYKIEVDAARVRGDINEQNVRIFSEQVRAQLARSEAYRAQVEGFKANIDAERAKIDAYGSEVQAYKALVEAHAAEWDGYRSQVQANAEEGKLYETLARVYGSRVDVWRTKGEAEFAQQRGNLASADALLRQHESQVRAALAKLQASSALIAAQSAQNESSARVYSTEAGIEATVSESNARAFAAATERARAESDLALRDVSLQIEQLLGIKGLILEALKSSAQASSQVAASSLSALNVGASISSNQSRSKACSTSFNYSGEIIDAL